MEGFDHGWPYWPKETMNWRPLGHTVIIDPDLPPEKSDGGIVMPEDKYFVPTSGTVVAVGKGSKSILAERKKAYARAASMVMQVACEHALHNCMPKHVMDMVERIRSAGEVPQPTPSVCVGDRVVFPATAGLLIAGEDGKQYVQIEEDLIAIVVEESVA